MLQLPAAWLYHKAFYRYMIHRELPHLRHVPYANSGARLTGQAPTLVPPRESLVDHAQAFGLRAVRKVVRTLQPLRRRPAPWLVLGDAALLADIRELIHVTPSQGDVLDIRRCDDFIQKVRTGVYRNYAHEEVLGGLTSMCWSAAALRSGPA
jgi:hypothetical protein